MRRNMTQPNGIKPDKTRRNFLISFDLIIFIKTLT